MGKTRLMRTERSSKPMFKLLESSEPSGHQEIPWITGHWLVRWQVLCWVKCSQVASGSENWIRRISTTARSGPRSIFRRVSTEEIVDDAWTSTPSKGSVGEIGRNGSIGYWVWKSRIRTVEDCQLCGERWWPLQNMQRVGRLILSVGRSWIFKRANRTADPLEGRRILLIPSCAASTREDVESIDICVKVESLNCRCSKPFVDGLWTSIQVDRISKLGSTQLVVR